MGNTDLSLEANELLYRNSDMSVIRVDKQIFDDFVADSYIFICFVDTENPDEIFCYRMTEETDEYIEMEAFV